MNRCLCFSFLIFCFSLYGDPWGKDADLVNPKRHQQKKEVSSNLLTQFGIRAVRFHQEVISPADGPRSHFIPSSSQYTLEAMQKYGFFKGVAMGCDRLMRENKEEWVYRKIVNEAGHEMKWDPVP